MGAVMDPGFTSTQIPVVINGTLTEFEESLIWPTTTSLAPGCTLGCLQCAVTGGAVRLLYWPEGSTTQNNYSSATLASNNASPMIAVTLGSTFTSPTLYISFGTLFASDSCSGVGPTIYNTIVPISASELSSIWATWYGPEAFTASFNVTDLNKPVATSVYNSQMRCALSTMDEVLSWEAEILFWNTDTASYATHNVTCANTLPYQPILALAATAFGRVDPAWAACSIDIRGLYDPPTALTSAIALTTAASESSAQSTTPAHAQQQATHAAATQTATDGVSGTLESGKSGQSGTAGSSGSDSSSSDPASLESQRRERMILSRVVPTVLRLKAQRAAATEEIRVLFLYSA